MGEYIENDLVDIDDEDENYEDDSGCTSDDDYIQYDLVDIDED